MRTPPINHTISCRPHYRPAGGHAALAALARVVAANDNPAVLGGNPSVKGVSIFAAEPVAVFTFALDDDHPFEQLHRFLSRYTLDDTSLPDVRFCGGWIGYFGYELGRFIETLPHTAVDDVGLPVIRLGFYDKAIVFDHAKNAFSFAAVDLQDGCSVASKFDVLGDWFKQAQQQAMPPTAPATTAQPTTPSCNMTQGAYFEALEKIHRHIIDGDVYQINFSQRFSMPFDAAPIDVFCWQNTHNPSPYAAYLAWGDTAVVSASPELFLEVRGDNITTCPIKGTRRRNGDLDDAAPQNRAQFDALVQSDKDQAELAMIVDLERNDVARVCVPGTRSVPCARRIEAFPTVYHAVATVAGTLDLPPGPERIEHLLRAMFPGGSITGAPKIRAMAIIDALEPTARGVYTGGIGWIGLNFDLCLNIAIRTLVISNHRAYVQTGGGIVADSVPQAEWDETLTKADALLRSLQAVQG